MMLKLPQPGCATIKAMLVSYTIGSISSIGSLPLIEIVHQPLQQCLLIKIFNQTCCLNQTEDTIVHLPTFTSLKRLY